MKKNIRIGTLSVFVFLFVSLLLSIACNKNKNEETKTKAGVPSWITAEDKTYNPSSPLVYLEWDDVGEWQFNLYRSNSLHGQYERIGDSQHSGGGVAGGYDYDPLFGDNYYRVSAGRGDREGEKSSAYAYYYNSYNGGGSSTISAPTGVSAEVSGSRVCVTWNSVSNASHYKVYRASSSSGSYSVIASSTSNTYYYDASPNTNNYYKVTAVNSSGTESEKSDYAYCYYSSGGGGGGSAPSAPTGVSAEVSGSKIYVSWNSVSNANEYYIFWSNSSGSGYQQVGTTSNTYYYDNYPGEYNYYKIKAKNSYGESSYSSYAYCHYSSGGGGGGGGSTNYAPCPPSVSASGTASSISVSWTKATGTGCGSPNSYKVYKRNPFTSSYELLTTTSSTSYRDYDVHPGINRYAVEAINNYGSDAGYGYSSSITLSKPTSFKAVKSGQDYIKFTWNKVNQATGYQIFQSSTASGTYYIFEQVEDVNTLTKYFPGVSGTTYYFKIKAIWDTGGYGGYETSDLSSWTSVTF